MIKMFCFSEDILIFLTGEEEIESVVKTLREVSHSQSGTVLYIIQLMRQCDTILSSQSSTAIYIFQPK